MAVTRYTGRESPQNQHRLDTERRQSVDSLSQDHRKIALFLLNNYPSLSHKIGGFLGNVCVTESLTEKQRAWLMHLVKRHGLPKSDSDVSI